MRRPRPDTPHTVPRPPNPTPYPEQRLINQSITPLPHAWIAPCRQDVRESRFGFLKGTEMEGVAFDPKVNFYMDPVR